MLASAVSHSLEPLSIGTTISAHKLWVPRISAAVAQEEVVVVANDDGVEEENVNEEEVVAAAEEEEDTVTDSSVRSTKLYFGNLPYSVDSAQLAGLIEEYGSAELIEVLM